MICTFTDLITEGDAIYMAKICLVLTGSPIEEYLEIIRKNRNFVDIVELRTDLLEEQSYDQITNFPAMAELPVILTCRKTNDGGSWSGTESLRKDKLLEWLDGLFAYVDLELDIEDIAVFEEKASINGTRIIRSFHNFDAVPSDLYNKMVNASRESTAIIKGAVYPKSSEDLFNLVDVSIRLKKSNLMSTFILLGMGDYGFITRILTGKLGSFLTFCSDDSTRSGAPGHCSASDLIDIYNFNSINDDTDIYAIIGNPLKQSRSPQIHNKGYRKNCLNAVYVPFLTDSPCWFMKLADLLDIKASSVTVPFKSEIIPLVDSIDEAVIKIGASNTIFRGKKGKWCATNTDAHGFIKPLLDFLGCSNLKDRKISLIGAGGAARAALFSLLEKEANVVIFNRTVSKGELLSSEFGCRVYPLDSSSLDILREYNSIIVQTTNVGMAPFEGINPISFYEFSGDEVVYDIIYKPEKTVLMKKASNAGCRILGGYKMLEEQAYLQFKIFTGVDY
ncbi:MAG: type I 3-dehydroquinate dehydratase [Deltaproteobacteria bacterium]|nr:type I 3-dehydroquinate dehydratase [Deltaproteobacteria bacterium]